jgi:hypothetical protein
VSFLRKLEGFPLNIVKYLDPAYGNDMLRRLDSTSVEFEFLVSCSGNYWSKSHISKHVVVQNFGAENFALDGSLL